MIKLKAGASIDNLYEVVAELGEGGMATVYRCKRRYGGTEEVAVKVLNETIDTLDMQRFYRERAILERVKSQHVVRLQDTGLVDKARPYMVLEYIRGGSLQGWMSKHGPCSEQIAAWVVYQAIIGLLTAKIVHRDLKPENLLLANPGDGPAHFIPGDTENGTVVKVVDFGLAKDSKFGVALTATKQIAGTPLYMSPEQCHSTKKVTVSTDIYALGIILFEMLVGQTPFMADDHFTVMRYHVEREPAIPSTWSPHMQRIVKRCLEKNPNDRYRSLSSLQGDLQAVFHRSVPPTVWERILKYTPFSRASS